MKKLIITVLMMCFAQGAFGSDSDCEPDAKDVAAATADLSARERAYALSILQKIHIRIACLDGTTFQVSIAITATVEELKRQIAKLREISAASFELFVKDVEDKLTNNRAISDLGFTDGPVLFMLIIELNAETDKEALIKLYESTNGENWTNKGGWNTDVPLSEWEEVTVDEEGRVIMLDLQSNNLTGPIPASLGQLTALEELNLNCNQLTGTIPTELGNLTALTWLDLSYNRLEGTIPVELGELGNLEELDLSNNRLTGAIPAELGQLGALKGLCLSCNKLEGPIPAELGQLGALEWLILSYNELSGEIPAELMEFEENIRPGNQLD